MLEKNYHPQGVEERLYRQWEESGAFAAGKRQGAEPYVIMLPPPNVTGSLHIGHALNHTIIDILIRYHRMRGFDVLWQPGTDHAGIATQLVVERQLRDQQTSRVKLGRDAFIKRVWEWKAESGGTITRQMRRLGASCDWSRERFTMDEGLSRAVVKVFVELHREGLIYKDKRLVNWDPSLQTAVSDLEVESIEVRGHLWHLRYPLADDPDTHIVVATTRPETMLGDTAVAVHPDDTRYKALVGKQVRLPLSGRLIPIIADEYSDPEKGSGAVKITPAHDFNDFEVGKRHGLEPISILDVTGRLNAQVPEAYRGMDRFDARKRVVADLDALGLLEKVEDITHAVPHDEKSKTVVLEPMLTEQWYCNVAPLAEKAMAMVRKGETKFVPDNWERVFFQWLENIQPWCISRQLWWGHQIPAWYDKDGKVYVAETEAEARAQAGPGVTLTRDPDVLDTWFSSALWPYSTLGWPEKTQDMARYYPGAVLVTMYDIIFFWVARMMMTGTHFLGHSPFHTVLLHARVVDEKGQKMSKTKGNVVDPLTLIDEFGADALRFSLAVAAAPGRDLRAGRGRVEPYRNFCTKIWNAARFCEMNECEGRADFDPSAVRETLNRWIISELVKTEELVRLGIEAYRFNDAASALYQFVWNVYCDWFLEFSKPVFGGAESPAKTETRETAAWVLDQILLLLHPFMPFITEELWARVAEHGLARKSPLILADWPHYPHDLIDKKASDEVNLIVEIISEMRSVRSEMNVPPSSKAALLVKDGDIKLMAMLERYGEAFERMGRALTISPVAAFDKGVAQFVAGGQSFGVSLTGLIDVEKEGARLKKEIARLDADITKADAKLNNADFVARAPEQVIVEQRDRRDEAVARRDKLSQALTAIS